MFLHRSGLNISENFRQTFPHFFGKILQKIVMFEFFSVISAQILMKIYRNFADIFCFVKCSMLKISEFFEFSSENYLVLNFARTLPPCSLFPFSFHSCGPFLYFGSNAASLKWFFSRRCFSWFSLDSKNSDRNRI